jgi:flagellar hook-associated protein 3 FlgL
MRVDSNYYAQILNSLDTTEQQEQTDVLQLSTNLSVNEPSDNPTAAAQDIGYVAAVSDAAQYEQNVSSTQTMMQSATSALSSVVTSLNSAISQGVEAGNGTVTAAQQTEMAATVSGIRNQIISLANTSVQGVYLFGGTASSNPPFQLNADSTTGVTYNGNSGINTVPVGNNETVQSNVPGEQIFSASSGNVMQSLTDLINAMQSNSTSGIQSATTEVQNALQTVSLQQGFYSSTSNQLDADNTYLQNETVSLQSQENNLVGSNSAQVITDLTEAQTTQQATLAAIAKIAPMSLLNYLGN